VKPTARRRQPVADLLDLLDPVADDPVPEPPPAASPLLRPPPVAAAALTVVLPRRAAFAPPRPFVPEATTDPLLARHAAELAAAGDALLALDASIDGPPTAVFLDVEVFPNLFVACLRRADDGRRVAFELSARCALDRDGLAAALRAAAPLVTFNGAAYDLPVCALALAGATNAELKAASDRLVAGELRPWEAAGELGVTLPRADHVDLMEPNPSVRQGLKMLYGRLMGRLLADMPFDEGAWLTPPQMNLTIAYCLNDLEATRALWEALREPMALRVEMSRRYGIDLRSRSDAQIGEAVIRKRVEGVVGHRVARASEPSTFRYEPPEFVRFSDPALRDLLDGICTGEFRVDGTERIVPPKALDGAVATVAGNAYALGIGGLHSREAKRALRSDGERVLIDVDLSSQYPNILRRLGLYPPALGPAFLSVYGSTIDERAAAKAAGNRTLADGGKIQLNGVGGKLNSSGSVFYSPRTFIAMTLTGQLSILSFVERAEAIGMPVVSANTDGVTMLCPRAREDALDALIREFEEETTFSFERAHYTGLFSASVNSYVALKEDGSTKLKGPLADPWSENDLRGMMSKNPQMTVVSRAVVASLRDGTPPGETVAACGDPRAFVTVIKVNDGGSWRGRRLGRVVRFYWSTDGEPILYVGSGRRVAKTEGAAPMMELPDAVPADLDRRRYVAEAERWLEDLGVDPLLGR
jgi:hypothetical protein